MAMGAQMLTIASENFLSEAEAAHLLNWTISTLRTHRARRRGPPVVKHGRTPLYREVSVLAWLKSREIDLEAARQ